MTRSKVVELGGKKFEVRKLPPDVGSFIFMRMLGVSMRSAVQEKEETTKPVTNAPSVPDSVITGEMRVRALSFAVFSGGIGFDDFSFIQTACMKVVSTIVNRVGQDFPVPVMTDGGKWSPDGEDLANDVGLVVRLTTEVLIFCFSDFFEGGDLGM